MIEGSGGKHVVFIGVLIFFGLYFYSSTLYPGGSQEDLTTKGFDWVNNYWCNLLNVEGMNGQPNPARPYAISAMVILCLSLVVFFIRFAITWPLSTFWKRAISVGGVISMVLATLMFTVYHDLMLMLSSLFGIIVVIGIIKAIYTSNLSGFKWMGLFCIFLLLANNYIYYSEHLITALPLLQKVTLLLVLVWILSLNEHLNKLDLV